MADWIEEVIEDTAVLPSSPSSRRLGNGNYRYRRCQLCSVTGPNFCGGRAAKLDKHPFQHDDGVANDRGRNLGALTNSRRRWSGCLVRWWIGRQIWKWQLAG